MANVEAASRRHPNPIGDKPATCNPVAGGVNPPLHESVLAPAEEFQKSQVAQHLKLLADFVADVAVLRMESRERALGI